MSRDITSTVKAALEGASVVFVLFVELAFDSAAVRVTSAPQTVSWDGHDWIGVGSLGAVQEVEETPDGQALGVAMSLTGVDPGVIAVTLTEHYQGRAADVWLAPLDPSTLAILADPVKIFSGRMDEMTVELGGTATVTVTAESRLADLERARVRRFNDSDQQAEYPDDQGFRFVEQMIEKEIVWGRA